MSKTRTRNIKLLTYKEIEQINDKTKLDRLRLLFENKLECVEGQLDKVEAKSLSKKTAFEVGDTIPFEYGRQIHPVKVLGFTMEDDHRGERVLAVRLKTFCRDLRYFDLVSEDQLVRHRVKSPELDSKGRFIYVDKYDKHIECGKFWDDKL